MDNFKAVYKILSALEKSMDYPEFDMDRISAETLGVSQERLNDPPKMVYRSTERDFERGALKVTRYEEIIPEVLSRHENRANDFTKEFIKLLKEM